MIVALVSSTLIGTPLLLWIYSRYITEVPRQFIKSGTRLHKKVLENLRFLDEKYHPSWWCPFGTAQTIARQLFRSCPDLPFERELVEFPDGGCTGIDWLVPEGADEKAPIVVFLPGITGSTRDCAYLLHPAEEVHKRGWKCVVVNPRGLGGVELRTARTYNAANTDDIEFVLNMIKKRYPSAKKLGCGFSMGGMILWNYLARMGETAELDGGMIVSSPWDPMATSDSIEQFIPKITFNRFIANNLIKIVKPYRQYFEGKLDFEQVCRSRTVRDFDKSFVTPMFGYASYEEYYKAAALNTKVHQIKTPTVTLNAADDYFSPVDSIPTSKFTESDHVLGIVTNHGGHTAFMQSWNPNDLGLVEKLLINWANVVF